MINNNQTHFNLNATIENPLRIIFLCGSFFSEEGKEVNEYKDKRVVMTNYLKNLNDNYRSLILEENFLFKRDSTKLNYNDIGLKSLKSIELLTSIISDRIIIFHESYSTAAEIGLFSSNKEINEKMLILAPDIYTFEDRVISGFIKLAYNNEYFEENNIKVLNYYPGVYNYKLSENTTKLHTYFPNNEIGKKLGGKLIGKLEIPQNLKITLKQKDSFFKSNTYSLKNGVVEVNLQANYFVSYLISLFTIDEIKKKVREKINKGRKHVIFNVSNTLQTFLKQFFITALEDQYPREKIENINILINGTDINLRDAINYFVYVLYGLKLLGIDKDHARITVDLDTVSKGYSSLIVISAKNELSELIG
ncbi:hypothetical protein [Lysinibacillus fusiformis]|uniref:hypothetical protein n=1 Tax=Lysinibacillus fusiformis TaxID=28031 RepID=UPI0011A9A6F3|nr:hypothetical protein [Lysinibacillus fusiformis]